MEEYEQPMRQIRVPKLGPPVPIVTPIAVELFVQVLYPPVEAGGYFERPMESLSCVLKAGGREFPAQTNIDGTMYVALPAYPGEKLLDFGELGTVDLGHSQRRPFYDLSAELERWSESYFVAGRMGAPEPAPAPRAPPPPIQLPPAAPPAVQPPVPFEPLPLTSGVARILARFVTLAEFAGTRAVVALALLWPSKVAPNWVVGINPQTRKPYASKEEYDAVWNQRCADKNESAKATTQADGAPIAKSRRNPSQTCDDETLDRLQKEKRNACKSFPGSQYDTPLKRTRMPCSVARARVQAFRNCIEARWAVQNECFGGSPDPAHAEQLDQLSNGLSKAIELEQSNCAPGHPMVGK